MRVTPLDIIQKQFTPSRRGGYEPDEVGQFLDDLRVSMEDLLKENQQLREELVRRDARIAELHDAEDDIKKTLMLARKLSDDLDRGARREADVIVGEARLEAERILMTAADERRELQADVLQLRASRARMIADLQAVLDVYSRMLGDLERDPPVGP